MSLYQDEQLIRDEFKDVKDKYPELELIADSFGELRVEGVFHFLGQHGSTEVVDRYQLSIRIPFNYPESLPTVREIGGRIPSDFHHNMDGSLCLDTPSRLRRMFRECPTLLGFLQGPIIAFLYGHHVFTATGKMPFGEWNHGALGLLDAYRQELGFQDPLIVVAFIKILADKSFPRQMTCPCGSGHKLRNCHKSQILTIMKHTDQRDILYEAHKVIEYLRTISRTYVPDSLLPKVRLTEELRNEWRGAGK